MARPAKVNMIPSASPNISLAAKEMAFSRIWRGFMTARIAIGLVILSLHIVVILMGNSVNIPFLIASTSYCLITVLTRIFLKPQVRHNALGIRWLPTIGIDLLAFSLMDWLQSATMNYAPLFGLPLLLAAVLGSRLLAMATAAAITFILFADVWLQTQGLSTTDSSARLLQVGMTGTGYFIVAFLAHLLATRLAREEQLALQSQITIKLQTQVNELVIENLSDGVLVVNDDYVVRIANPAAKTLLGQPKITANPPFSLTADPAWSPLISLVDHTLLHKETTQNLTLQHPNKGSRQLHVRTRITTNPDALFSTDARKMCVMFLHDLREMEAHLRTEKLASMGRMSAAVAHEIRNPLAAITQANALLAEDITDIGQQKLIGMIAQNSKRLSKIVDDVLDIARVQHRLTPPENNPLALDLTLASICHDWSQSQCAQLTHPIHLSLNAHDTYIEFDIDHLRRIVVNLLDNAMRYKGSEPDSLQINTWINKKGSAHMQVWSDGLRIEESVKQHLFEPFFSSESRSSGLGLYICKELCDRHRASIDYHRIVRSTQQGDKEGNAFFVRFDSAKKPPVNGYLFDSH